MNKNHFWVCLTRAWSLTPDIFKKVGLCRRADGHGSGVVYVSSPYVVAYQTVVRFAIGLGVIVIMFESLRTRQYKFTALFGAVVLLFNPVVPTFALAGN